MNHLIKRGGRFVVVGQSIDDGGTAGLAWRETGANQLAGIDQQACSRFPGHGGSAGAANALA